MIKQIFSLLSLLSVLFSAQLLSMDRDLFIKATPLTEDELNQEFQQSNHTIQNIFHFVQANQNPTTIVVDPNKELISAIEDGNNTLLQEKLASNTLDGLNLEKLLARAIIERNHPAIQLLLKAGANCTACSPFGGPKESGLLSFLMYDEGILLPKDEEQAILETIVSAGCGINTPLMKNLSPLQVATTVKDLKNKSHIVQKLIELGASVNLEHDTVPSPLHWCVDNAQDTTDVIKVLINAGANVNAQNARGETPLRRAISSNYYATVELFLSTPGINPTLLSNDGKSDLEVAEEKGYRLISRMLKKYLGTYSEPEGIVK